jgi:multiple sugar transport system ATP-binding protein
VIAGVRPEDLRLGGAGRADQAAGATLTADVRVVEMLGSEKHAFFAIDAAAAGASALAAAAGEAEADAGLLAEQAHNGMARLDPRSAVRPGQRVTFGVDPRRLHFFDPGTGLAIR